MLKKIKETWVLLGRPIYVGDRLRQNMQALTAISIFCALLGLALMVMNFINGQRIMFVTSAATFLAAVACAHRRDRRRL